jgi:hypothetical protein
MEEKRREERMSKYKKQHKTKEEIVSITIDFLKGVSELENRTVYQGFCLIDKKIIVNKIEQLERLLRELPQNDEKIK